MQHTPVYACAAHTCETGHLLHMRDMRASPETEASSSGPWPVRLPAAYTPLCAPSAAFTTCRLLLLLLYIYSHRSMTWSEAEGIAKIVKQLSELTRSQDRLRESVKQCSVLLYGADHFGTESVVLVRWWIHRCSTQASSKSVTDAAQTSYTGVIHLDLLHAFESFHPTCTKDLAWYAYRKSVATAGISRNASPLLIPNSTCRECSMAMDLIEGLMTDHMPGSCTQVVFLVWWNFKENLKTK